MRKKINDSIIKRLENESKISENYYELIYSMGSRSGILYGSPKVQNQLLITAPNSALFCQPAEHLLKS